MFPERAQGQKYVKLVRRGAGCDIPRDVRPRPFLFSKMDQPEIALRRVSRAGADTMQASAPPPAAMTGGLAFHISGRLRYGASMTSRIISESGIASRER